MKRVLGVFLLLVLLVFTACGQADARSEAIVDVNILVNENEDLRRQNEELSRRLDDLFVLLDELNNSPQIIELPPTNSASDSSDTTAIPPAPSTMFTEVLQPFERSSSNFSYVSSVVMAGITYGSSIRINAQQIGNSARAEWGLFNLGGQFNEITGTGIFDATINFIGDGRILASLELNALDMPSEILVNVEGVTQLRIELLADIRQLVMGSTTGYAIAEAILR